MGLLTPDPVTQEREVTFLIRRCDNFFITFHGGIASTDRSVDRNQLVQLRQFFDTHFSEDELRTVCFDLGVDYDNLAGAGKAGKARELVAYHERHGRISELMAVARQLRPDVYWANAADQHMLPELLLILLSLK